MKIPVVQEKFIYRSKLIGREIMTDLIYIGVVVVFFIVGAFYAQLCEKM